ncbi:MAG: hypothetical protein K2Q12_06795 [Rickettsiales bacterium]|nr:hypothetical protein [Rickettsiales bacterium]
MTNPDYLPAGGRSMMETHEIYLGASRPSGTITCRTGNGSGPVVQIPADVARVLLRDLAFEATSSEHEQAYPTLSMRQQEAQEYVRRACR